MAARAVRPARRDDPAARLDGQAAARSAARAPLTGQLLLPAPAGRAR
ncbi:hypothetical protein [Streptomyces shenzhenensis]